MNNGPSQIEKTLFHCYLDRIGHRERYNQLSEQDKQDVFEHYLSLAFPKVSRKREHPTGTVTPGLQPQLKKRKRSS